VKYRYVKVCEHIHHEIIDSEDARPEIVHVICKEKQDNNVVIVDGNEYPARAWWSHQPDEWKQQVLDKWNNWKVDTVLQKVRDRRRALGLLKSRI
jgi:hypothetical protein